MPEGHGGALSAALERCDRSASQSRQTHHCGRARQYHSRAGEVPRQRIGKGYRGAEHSDRHSAGVRTGRCTEATAPLLSGQPGEGKAGCGRGGSAGARQVLSAARKNLQSLPAAGMTLFAMALFMMAVSAGVQAGPQDELKDIRDRIEALKKELTDSQGSKTEAADALKD